MGVEILIGDCRERLAGMAADSVDCVVTSPPYLGLRDYGIEPVVWPALGLDPRGHAACAHEWGEWSADHDEREVTKHGKTRTTDRYYGDESRRFDGNHQKHTAGQFCRRCNAWRGSLGLEPTPDLYVEHMVEVMRAVRRVLKPTGTVWFNIGDSYAGGGNGGGGSFTKDGIRTALPGTDKNKATRHGRRGAENGLKPKDLMMMPARVALALQADGWWIRSEIVWAKPNPMPESVTDRPTSAHEKIFLLTKNGGKALLWRARDTREWSESPDLAEIMPDGETPRWRGFDYWYDADAVRESAEYGRRDVQGGSMWNGQMRADHRDSRSGGTHAVTGSNPALGRNLRNVWDLATQPYPEAHFATFPVKLAERCILAGCPPGGTVLDPFGGAGTVGLAAEGAGRAAVLIEINSEYAAMATARIRAGLGQVASEAVPVEDHGPLFAAPAD